MSGIRESNPPPRLGKPVHYRCANSACMYFNNFVIMNFAFVASLFKEPIPGLEPGTYALRMRCSTNWAISAKSECKDTYKKGKIKIFADIFACKLSNMLCLFFSLNLIFRLNYRVSTILYMFLLSEAFFLALLLYNSCFWDFFNFW